MISLLAQPWFAILQTMFVVAAFGLAAIGIIDGELPGIQIFAVIAIPAITFAGVVRIYRRLQAVRAERAPDESEELLAGALLGMECMATLAVIALVAGSIAN